MGKNHNKRRNMSQLTFPDDMDSCENATSSIKSSPLPPTPSKSPPSKIRAINNDDSTTGIILEKLSSIEKASHATANALETLTSTVQSLLNQVSIHSEKIQKIDSEPEKLKQENTQLKLKMNEMQRHSRLWNLKIHGLKEADDENIRELVIGVLVKVAPHICDHIPSTVDIVHRLGAKRKDGSHRTTIVRFSMRHYRDHVWKAAKNNAYLLSKNLRITEALSPDDAAARAKLCPLVKKAKEEGKKTSFKGPHAYIDGQRITLEELKP